MRTESVAEALNIDPAPSLVWSLSWSYPSRTIDEVVESYLSSPELKKR